MSATYEFSASLIKLDSVANQISKAVAELNRHNIPKPFKVQLTLPQYDLLRRECVKTMHYKSLVEESFIHGCQIEVIGEKG